MVIAIRRSRSRPLGVSADWLKGRDINRHHHTAEEITEALRRPVVRHFFASQRAADGSISLGLSTNTLSSSNSRKANNTPEQRDNDAARDVFAATLALATAVAISAVGARSTSAVCSPVAGL